MKINLLLKSAAAAAALILALPAGAVDRYAGGDISLLPEYEKVGSKYKDYNGKSIPDLLPWLREQGLNSMRVRLFVNPDDYTGSDKDANACQTLEYITPLCKDIVNDGFGLMLDFHYSDTWADPAKQWTPKVWANLTDEQLYQKIYDYTRDTLESLKAEGIVPEFIQPGNEISYGMLWGPYGTPNSQLKKVNWDNNDDWVRFTTLLKRAIQACREVCPDAKIVLHTERLSNQKKLLNFYEKMKEYDVDYDIIGLSYYPYFHGKIHILVNGLRMLSNNFADKEMMIVETGYPYKWEVPGTDKDVDYPYTDKGQDDFMQAVVKACEEFPQLTGIYWWWMEYNAFGSKPALANWYNAPLFDSNTGRACSALKTLASFASDSSAVDNIIEDETEHTPVWYDINGRRIARPDAPGLYIDTANRRKVAVK